MSVAKFPTDVEEAKRHRRRSMPRYPVNKKKFRELRVAQGFRSDAALWRAVTGRDERSEINKILSGEREPKPHELYDMATALKVPQIELMIVLGIKKESDAPKSLTIWGLISDGGNIMSGVAIPEMDHQIYPLSAHLYGGNLLRVGDDSMGERYRRHDLVGFGEHTTAFADFMGFPVVAHLKNGTEVLRVLHPGGALDTYALVAVVQDRRFPPIINAEIEWIAPIEAIFPATPG